MEPAPPFHLEVQKLSVHAQQKLWKESEKHVKAFQGNRAKSYYLAVSQGDSVG
jgi:hypothetical protein